MSLCEQPSGKTEIALVHKSPRSFALSAPIRLSLICQHGPMNHLFLYLPQELAFRSPACIFLNMSAHTGYHPLYSLSFLQYPTPLSLALKPLGAISHFFLDLAWLTALDLVFFFFTSS